MPPLVPDSKATGTKARDERSVSSSIRIFLIHSIFVALKITYRSMVKLMYTDITHPINNTPSVLNYKSFLIFLNTYRFYYVSTCNICLRTLYVLV